MKKNNYKFSTIKNLNNYIFLRLIALLIANVFICWNIQPAVFGGNLKPYYVYNSSPTGFGGNWDFKSNTDGENTITLVKCCNSEESELKSPILSYDVTRVEDNFSLVKKVTDYRILNKIKYGLMSICCLPAAVFIIAEGQENGKFKTLRYNIYSNITSVDLPKCISVGESAFRGNKNLVSVSLPECTSVGTSAFKDNENLVNINLSKNYKTVESKTFKGCSKFSNIPNEEFLEKLCREAFGHSNIKKANLKSCKIAECLSFGGCHDLTSINLPSCTNIGEFCFNWCEKLVEVNLPKCIYLEEYAFNRCSSLTELDLPNVQEIKSGTFSNCSKLESIYLPKCKKISAKAFYGCGDSEKVKIESCKSLKKIVVPKDCIIEEGALPEDKIKCIQRV